MKSKLCISLICGLMSVAIIGCDSNPKDKIIGHWEPEIKSSSPISCNNKIEFRNKDDNIVVFMGDESKATQIGVAEQSSDNQNIFKVPFGQINLNFTYFKSDDTVQYSIPILCPNVILHRVK